MYSTSFGRKALMVQHRGKFLSRITQVKNKTMLALSILSFSYSGEKNKVIKGIEGGVQSI